MACGGTGVSPRLRVGAHGTVVSPSGCGGTEVSPGGSAWHRGQSWWLPVGAGSVLVSAHGTGGHSQRAGSGLGWHRGHSQWGAPGPHGCARHRVQWVPVGPGSLPVGCAWHSGHSLWLAVGPGQSRWLTVGPGSVSVAPSGPRPAPGTLLVHVLGPGRCCWHQDHSRLVPVGPGHSRWGAHGTGVTPGGSQWERVTPCGSAWPWWGRMAPGSLPLAPGGTRVTPGGSWWDQGHSSLLVGARGNGVTLRHGHPPGSRSDPRAIESHRE